MLPALAAAVIAGLSSLPRAFAAGRRPRGPRPAGPLEQRQAVGDVRGAAGRAVLRAADQAPGHGPGRGGRRRGHLADHRLGAARCPLRSACCPRCARRGCSWEPSASARAARRWPGVGSPSQLNIATVASCYAVVAVSARRAHRLGGHRESGSDRHPRHRWGGGRRPDGEVERGLLRRHGRRRRRRRRGRARSWRFPRCASAGSCSRSRP